MLWRARQLTLLTHAGLYERAIGEAASVLEFDSKSYLAYFAIAQARIHSTRRSVKG